MLRMIAETSHLQIIPPEGYDKRISFHDPRIEQEASRMRRIGIRYVPSANGTRSTQALSGNIGSYAADSMVRRCGPPTPPPARAADSDTLDPGTVRPSVPVYDKPVSRPRSCMHAPAPLPFKRCATGWE